MKSTARRRLCGILTCFVVGLPCVASAQLDVVIEKLRSADLLRPADPSLDAIVACIITRDFGGEVEEGFKEDTGITLDQLLKLLGSEPEGRLRTGVYEDYGIGDAFALGVAPVDSLSSIGTAYAVPGHVLLSRTEQHDRDMLLDAVVSGEIAAARHSEIEGDYAPVLPSRIGWHAVLEQIRGEPWDFNDRGHWQGNNLVVEGLPHAPDGLQFVVSSGFGLDDGSERVPVIAWEAAESLPESLRFDYTQSLYFSISDAALSSGCITGET